MSRISDKLLPMYIYVVFTIMYNYNFYICIQVTCNVVYTLVHACHLCKPCYTNDMHSVNGICVNDICVNGICVNGIC